MIRLKMALTRKNGLKQSNPEDARDQFRRDSSNLEKKWECFN